MKLLSWHWRRRRRRRKKRRIAHLFHELLLPSKRAQMCVRSPNQWLEQRHHGQGRDACTCSTCCHLLLPTLLPPAENIPQYTPVPLLPPPPHPLPSPNPNLHYQECPVETSCTQVWDPLTSNSSKRSSPNSMTDPAIDTIILFHTGSLHTCIAVYFTPVY